MRLLHLASVLCAGILAFSANAQSFDEKIDALAKQLTAQDPYYQQEGFSNLSETTKGMVRLIDKNRARIELYKMAVNELKREPSLTHEQLRWLVEIEDLFVDADRSYAAARINYLFADKSAFVGENERTEAFRASSQSAALTKLGDASRKEDKAKRDLGTLRMRVEVQKKSN